MPILETEAAGWTAGALISITVKSSGDTFVRPAAFIFPLDAGIEWVEPGYADPWGAATPAYHRRAGRWDGAMLDTGDTVVEALPFDPELDRDARGATAVLWFIDWMAKQGLSWDAERARVRALVHPTPGA